jgi:hypothetical protein
MKMSGEFPSQFIRALDLQGKEHKLTMSHVEREKIGQDTKPVLYFIGRERGLVLNKTNAGAIADAYGDESDDWASQPIILFAIKTDFQGKLVDAIRVRVPTAKDNKPAEVSRRDPPRSQDPDDTIPF